MEYWYIKILDNFEDRYIDWDIFLDVEIEYLPQNFLIFFENESLNSDEIFNRIFSDIENRLFLNEISSEKIKLYFNKEQIKLFQKDNWHWWYLIKEWGSYKFELNNKVLNKINKVFITTKFLELWVLEDNNIQFNTGEQLKKDIIKSVYKTRKKQFNKDLSHLWIYNIWIHDVWQWLCVSFRDCNNKIVWFYDAWWDYDRYIDYNNIINEPFIILSHWHKDHYNFLDKIVYKKWYNDIFWILPKDNKPNSPSSVFLVNKIRSTWNYIELDKWDKVWNKDFLIQHINSGTNRNNTWIFSYIPKVDYTLLTGDAYYEKIIQAHWHNRIVNNLVISHHWWKCWNKYNWQNFLDKYLINLKKTIFSYWNNTYWHPNPQYSHISTYKTGYINIIETNNQDIYYIY